MTIAEKITQEKAYQAYLEQTAKIFAEAEDDSTPLSSDEAKKYEYMSEESQYMQVFEEA